MLKRLRQWWQNRKKPKLLLVEKEELRKLEYEEEALKRAKRINDLRTEVYRAAHKAAKAGVPFNEEGTQDAKRLNTPGVYKNAKGRYSLRKQ